MDATIEFPQQQPSEPVPGGVEQNGAKPIRVIVSRAYTLVILAISLALLLKDWDTKATNNADQNKQVTIGSLASQRFVLAAILIASVCNLLQLGMVIYGMKSITGKAIASSKYRIFFDYYIDKVVSLMLAVTVGAFGSSIDISQLKALKDVGSFISFQKISTALMSTVLVSTSVSCSCSEEAVKKYRESLEKREEAAGIFRSWATRVFSFSGFKFNS